MVRHFFFYITIILVAGLLFVLQNNHRDQIISFYGYADNKETEINFNHPVKVYKIYVKPGQTVHKGDPLIDVVRIQTMNTVDDEEIRINVVKAEKDLWATRVKGEIALLKDQQELELNEIKVKKEKLVSEENFTSALYEGLESVERPQQSTSKVEESMQVLDQEYNNTLHFYEQKIENKISELKAGNQPFEYEIDRLNHKINKNVENAEIHISISAPKDGLIGNVYCEEQEHFSSYKTMLSLYEPNPSIIKGFIQEDFITKVELNDSIRIRSTKDNALVYKGLVIGLGSRIIEIPTRLTKRPNIKTYGREIIVSIPENNKFLQKEKAVLELITLSPEKEISLLSYLISSK